MSPILAPVNAYKLAVVSSSFVLCLLASNTPKYTMRCLLSVIWLVLFDCRFAFGQNLTVNPNWRVCTTHLWLFTLTSIDQKASTTRTIAQRTSIAQNAINLMMTQLDSSTGQFASKCYCVYVVHFYLLHWQC